MRLLIAFLLVGALPASAQDVPPVLEDVTGDAQLNVWTAPVSPGDRFKEDDLVALRIEEVPEGLHFLLEVAGLPQQQTEDMTAMMTHQILFTYNTTQYRITITRSAGDLSAYFGSMERIRPAEDGAVQVTDRWSISVAPRGTTILDAFVERYDVSDEEGTPLMPGRNLTAFAVTARGLGVFAANTINLGPGGPMPFPDVWVSDAMPDDQAPMGSFPLHYGVTQTGHAYLECAAPIRSSNGDATTYIFLVWATNLGNETDRFTLAAKGVPQDWKVRLPAVRVDIPANGSVSFPVLVTTEFRHDHGSLEDFVLEMASTTNTSAVGRVRLGLHYTSIPQPTGHHNILYLHSAPYDFGLLNEVALTALGQPTETLYANAALDDPADSNAPAGPTTRSATLGTAATLTYQWFVPLSPSLGMGLDLDLFRTGTGSITLDTPLPLYGAVLSGAVMHRNPEGDVAALAVLSATEPADVAAQSKDVEFTTTLTPRDAGDYLEFDEVGSVWMVLNLTTNRPSGGSLAEPLPPTITEGAFELPLNEYHDAVATVSSHLTTSVLSPRGELNRLVNPGRTVVFNVTLLNQGAERTAFNVTVVGPGSAWARVLGPANVSLALDQAQDFAVALAVPANTTLGTRVDLLMVAAATDNLTAPAFLRLSAQVTNATDIPDEAWLVDEIAAVLQPGKSTPWPFALGVAGLLLAVRRRQKNVQADPASAN